MNKQIYIIGPVTGIDRKEAVAAFAKAASMVKEIGMVPVNPTEFVPAETPWREAMKLCINRLLECGAYIKLPGWDSSKGAMLEVIIAKNMDIPELAIYVGKFMGGGE
jgi:hypothetical protein